MSERKDKAAPRVVFVTGASGAGRTTAINVLEDLGFETINNLPLSLLERVLDVPSGTPPLALGIDIRNRDFSLDKVLAAFDRISEDDRLNAQILFLDSRADVLVRRFSETRRKHPLAPSETPEVGIAREMDLLVPIRGRADYVVDTSDMTPHQLRAEIERLFSQSGSLDLSLSVESFSFKRGLPRGVDMVFDVRFLANPHWEKGLRGLDGRDERVASYVEADPRFADFFRRISDLVISLLPAFKEEGKTYLAVGLGCTGGQHRSVAVAEKLAKTLAEHGWRVSTRHRELERRGSGAPRGTG